MKTAEEYLIEARTKQGGFLSDRIIKAMQEYATEAIKADRAMVAEKAKMVYHCGRTKNNYPTVYHQSGCDNIQIDKESILNLPIELPWDTIHLKPKGEMK